MSDTNTGGPAFPGLNAEYTGISSDGQERYEIQPSGGMTLRDYFAAKAMQGDIASMVDPNGERCGIQIDLPDENLVRLATLYYRMADAMLKARAG